MPSTHAFHAIAFVENLRLKELADAFPGARRTVHEISFATASGGTAFLYPFGAMVLCDVPEAEHKREIDRLRAARPGLTDAHASEELTVNEETGARTDMRAGALVVDKLSFEGTSVVAMTMAQSVAMDYYERIVDEMFSRTDHLVDRLERVGRAPLTTRPLHRFIGAATSGTRNEVSGLHAASTSPTRLWDDSRPILSIKNCDPSSTCRTATRRSSWAPKCPGSARAGPGHVARLRFAS